MLLAHELSFESLGDTSYPQEVSMRGFLYRTQAGDLVLAAEPNLKSCCVGAPHQVKKQIFVTGNIENPIAGKVYVVQGNLTVDPNEGRYLLRDAHVIQSQINASNWTAFFIVLIIIATLCLAYLRK